jgi:hypothetical protein
MNELKTEPGFANPDAAYEALVDVHRGLTDAESAALNARLVLILANHVGDLDVLKAAVALAKKAS